MSRRNLGGFIRPGYNPLRVPNAPTIGTASVASGTSASVAFTAPSCVGGGAITGYTAVSSPGCKVGTGSASPITVSCLTTCTAYTFRVYATNSYGPSAYSASSNSVTPAIVGQQAYTTAGTYSWVAPAGVTSVSVVAVGGGAGGLFNQYCAPCDPGYNNGGGGGGLGYKNNISVTPGSTYTVVVGDGGPARQCQGPKCSVNGNQSYFINTSTVRGGGGAYNSGGTYTGDGGGNGGTVAYDQNLGGAGGAGGYSGSGGAGGTSSSTTGKAGSGGGGGGGGYRSGCYSGDGGGVGILGQGTSGAAVSAGVNGNPGSGGSGKLYGGGMGNYANGSKGGRGAVRIIWPGTTRQFPSTNTGDL